jgi:dipeptidyl aminopeptidase/acylaminoacyl peptidase
MRYLLLVAGVFISSFSFSQKKIPITAASLDSLAEISDPEISPDGKWVSYTVSTVNHEKDYYSTDLWMTNWEGTLQLQLTHTPEADESMARWSPDHRFIAFLSSRKNKEEEQAEETSQLWLLNRLGGEAEKITSFPGGVEEFCWSPDGKKIALVVTVKDTAQFIPGTQTPMPLVIDRYYFKEDYAGYLGKERKRLFVLELDSRESFPVLTGDYEEFLPSWHPDGTRIAFVSKRARTDWDRDNNWDVWVAEAKPMATPIQLSKTEGADADPSYESPPSWSADGKWIAYFQGGPQKLIYYGTQRLAVSAADGKESRVLTAGYDRNIWKQTFSGDGKEIFFLAEDEQNLALRKIALKGGEIATVLDGRYTIYDFDVADQRIAAAYTTAEQPVEIFAIENGKLRQLTRHNEKWIQAHQLNLTHEFTATSKDGTVVQGHYVLPHDFTEGKKYPTILQIHGGPTSQNQNEWYADWQLYASCGYVLVSMNPRGSTGFGEKFATGIFGAWGTVDLEDDLAGVDELVKRGISDPARLAVEGWSYGGIATDFMIAKDHRFKCAVSGASIGNAFAGFGTDMYIREYMEELGTPWGNFQNYVNNSYPFLHADQIKTPTLFMCGELDFNVPLLNSEQMFQALKCNNIETQLVIYPDQYHGLDVPGYLRDRFERRKAWFDKFLK